MTKIKAPSDPDGLREVLTDHTRLKAYFSAEAVADGSTRDFLDSYAAVWAKQHPEAVRFFFGSSLLSLDLERQEARVGPPPRSQNQGEAVPGVLLGDPSCQGQGEGAGLPGSSSPTEDEGGAADLPLSLTAEESPVEGGTSPLKGSDGVRTIRCGGGRVNRCWSRPCMRP